MRYLIFLLALACAAANGDEWSPPDSPNPQAILQEARADTQAKRYETALAKHIWFHETALSIRPSLYGVRLSFALSYWHELAEVYPPALAKLKEFRDQAKKNVTEGTNVRKSFQEMNALNDVLDESSLTKDVFELLDDKNPTLAKEVFGLAMPSLVRAKAYSLINKYVAPEEDFARMLEMYERGKSIAENPRFGARHLDYANKRFTNEVATLVAILVVNDRKKEAQDIADSAREEWQDKAFKADIEKALTGSVPDPWP